MIKINLIKKMEEKRMKKFMSTLSLVFAIVMVMTSMVVPASASTTTSEETVKIVFYKPDNWGDNISIHLWNAKSYDTSWPGVKMEKSSNGIYTYQNKNLTSCNFVITDGNNQTSNLYCNGYVGVKDNKVFAKSDNTIDIYFKKPSNWSSNIRCYYYTDDYGVVSFMDWPGVAMKNNHSDDDYYLYVRGYKNLKVIFTDGNNQYPSSGESGISVSASQELIFEKNKYTVTNHKYMDFYTPSSSANVNKDFHIYVTFTESSHDNVYFKDENDNVINPTSEVTTRKNGKYFTDYTVKFSKEGSYKLTPCYIYHSGEVQVRDNILNVNVFSENYYGGSYLISDTDVNLGDTFTIKQYVPAKMNYYYYDSEGNELTPVSYDYKYESTGTYAYITFRTTKLGLNQKFTCKASHAYAPYGRMDVNQEIAINVWKNI